MKRLIAVLALSVAVVGAQVTPMVTATTDVRKLVPVKHVQTSDAQVESLMRALGIRASGPIAGYIVLNGPKDAVAAAEEVIQKMDLQKPAPDIEVTGWVIAAARGENELPPLPGTLQPVAKQLNAAFGYSNLRLLTSFIVRAHSGARGETTGAISPALGVAFGDYQFFFHDADLASDDHGVPVIHLHQMRLSINTGGGHSVLIQTDVDLAQGQKVVIGKSSVAAKPEGTPGVETPLMVILSARAASE
ncbi:MAG TPA: hypothetical protein VFA04_08650 [Bryobacteraceae bacterium]|nr:hypothetical protein [Bryobacteraceae bacterium]